MKALLIPLATLSVLLFCSLSVGCYVNRSVESWDYQLAQAAAAEESASWNSTASLIRSCYEDWQEQQTFFHIIIAHQELDEVKSLFFSTMAACNERDAPDFRIALAQLRGQLALLAETQQLSIKNVF